MDDPYFKNIPILALTASTTETTRDEIFLSGMQDFILKPINVDDLRAKIIEHSSITDQFRDLKITSDEENVVEEDSRIVFVRTDKLFLSNLVKYQEFLRMTINEFKTNLDLLKLSIIDEDLKKYRHIRHRMKSLMATFGMKELLMLLDEIKIALNKDTITKKQKNEFAKSLDYHINFLIDSFTNKLASLKWQ